MKSLKSSSIFTSNNSIILIIFVFIFIAVGMFFLINKTTEKQEIHNKKIIEEQESQNVKIEGGGVMGMINSIGNANTNNNSDNGGNDGYSDSYNTEYNTVTGTFQDEVGLFIKKEEPRPEIYSHSQTYIPPFNTGKETRCGSRQVNRPIENNNVQSCVNSDLVKVSSDASY